jgi:hypothetical protein
MDAIARIALADVSLKRPGARVPPFQARPQRNGIKHNLPLDDPLGEKSLCAF